VIGPFDIPKRARICKQCEQAFAPGVGYHSVLGDGEEEGDTVRSDFCDSCWEAVHDGIPHHTKWRGVMPKKKEKLPPLNRDDQAFALLREALESDDSSSRDEAFVLALYLQRRKVLALRDTVTNEDGAYSLYEVHDTGVVVSVPKASLTDLAVTEIQTTIARKLKGPPPEEEVSPQEEPVSAVPEEV
jgi:hypothetical protein